MRFLFCLVVSFLISVSQLSASCADYYFNLYPKSDRISANPVFLLEFDEGDFKLGNSFNLLKFYLLVNNERLVEVQTIQKIEGVGSNTQLLLKPVEELQLNDSIQFKVIIHGKKPEIVEDELFHVFDNLEEFQAACNKNWWQVKAEKDQIVPTGFQNLTWKYVGYNYTISEAMHGMEFTFHLQEPEIPIRNLQAVNPAEEYLFEVEIEGRKFFSTNDGNTFWVYYGHCGSNFPLQENRNYEATITALDFSGNRSVETRRIAFNTTP